MTIERFDKEYRFLSNFWLVPVRMEGLVFPSVEHAYQAAKFPLLGRLPFCAGAPGRAKKLGQQPGCRADWELIKVDVMEFLVNQKFTLHSDLRAALLATAPHELIEGNHWGDTFWGVCRGVGRNELGKILMRVRATL